MHMRRLPLFYGPSHLFFACELKDQVEIFKGKKIVVIIGRVNI
jgi:hypothetical protein